MNAPSFPDPPKPIPATPFEELDKMVARLDERKAAWLKVGIPERIQYLQSVIDGMLGVAEAWVADGCRAKGIDPGDSLAGEKWLVGVVTTVRNARLFKESLEQGGQPAVPKTWTRPDGQIVAQVFPTDLMDKAMFTGFSAEVWMEPGQPASQGRIYREAQDGPGCVSLVLGAGNVSSIPPMDLLYKLFVENEVSICKMNPVNEWCGPHMAKAFHRLIDDGFVAVCYGGVEVGAHLCEHPQIGAMHITGSDRTYDAIVWGSDPEEQARRKAANEPLNPRPFTAELGCVTPVMLVPGEWSASDLDFQARSVVGMVTHNASFNCNAAKVLVLAKGWPQREAFMERLRAAFRSAPPRKAYYPGTAKRYSHFLDQYPQAEKLGKEADEVVPWTLIPGVLPGGEEYALCNEAWCGVLAVVELDCTDASDFIPKATSFANDDCWGTLSCVVIIDPATEKANGKAFDTMIAGLHYGGIGVNSWAGLIYGLVSTTWGAYPGHTPQDIRSGVGVVHNSMFFDHPQKSVVRGPFKIWPPPFWISGHRNLAGLGKKMVALEAQPSWGKLIGVALNAFKG